MATTEFALDGYGQVWPAVRFGEPWNGWAMPVVTKATLVGLLGCLDGGYRWEGDVAVVWPTVDASGAEFDVSGSEDRLEPDIDGHYDLGSLGWVFVLV